MIFRIQFFVYLFFLLNPLTTKGISAPIIVPAIAADLEDTINLEAWEISSKSRFSDSALDNTSNNISARLARSESVDFSFSISKSTTVRIAI